MKVLILRQCVSGVGGTNMQLNRTADYLKKLNNLVDFEAHESEYDLLILPTSEIYRVYDLLNQIKINKVLIWVLGFGALKEAIFAPKLKLSIFWFISRLLVKSIHPNLVFSDSEGVWIDTGCEAKKLNVVPISISKGHFLNSNSISDKVVWIGRLSSDFKKYSLMRLMNDLNALGDSVLDVIGDGDCIDFLKAFAKKNKRLKVNFLGQMSMEDLDSTLTRENYRLAFSMGTSVLESATFGISSVIVMPMRTVKDYESKNVYRPVYESYGYSMGEFPESSKKQVNYTFPSINNKLNDLSRKNSYNYSKYFYIDNVANNLINLGSPVSFDGKLTFYIYKIVMIFKKRVKKWFKE